VVRLRRERFDGGWCEADLLRPRSWLGGAGVGCWVPVNLPEMGAHGLFRVLSVDPCPRVEPRPGEGFGLVTGTFRHGACRVLNVWLAGERDAIGVTGLHPFWSADRCGWVPAGSLQDGERVQGLDGPVRVQRVEERGDEPVFNLEVDADHCYRVGEQGVLVHNASASCSSPQFKVRTKSISAPWYTISKIDRVEYVFGIITESDFPRTNLPDPKWWAAYMKKYAPNAQNDDSRWEKGHAYGSRFGGPQTLDNLLPQHGIVNRSPWETCENRITEALCPGGCVEIHIFVEYDPNDPNSVRPTGFRLEATGHGASEGLDIDAVIPNRYNPRPPVPPDCRR
jgi:DNA/RNA non-specific endonuclease/Pretoxin HINT domain